MCLDTLGKLENAQIGLYACHGQGGNQVTFAFIQNLFPFNNYFFPKAIINISNAVQIKVGVQFTLLSNSYSGGFSTRTAGLLGGEQCVKNTYHFNSEEHSTVDACCPLNPPLSYSFQRL